MTRLFSWYHNFFLLFGLISQIWQSCWLAKKSNLNKKCSLYSGERSVTFVSWFIIARECNFNFCIFCGTSEAKCHIGIWLFSIICLSVSLCVCHALFLLASHAFCRTLVLLHLPFKVSFLYSCIIIISFIYAYEYWECFTNVHMSHS